MANRLKKMWSYAGLLPNPTVNSLTLYSPAHCHRAQHCTLHVGRVSIEPPLKRIRHPPAVEVRCVYGLAQTTSPGAGTPM